MTTATRAEVGVGVLSLARAVGVADDGTRTTVARRGVRGVIEGEERMGTRGIEGRRMIGKGRNGKGMMGVGARPSSVQEAGKRKRRREGNRGGLARPEFHHATSCERDRMQYTAIPSAPLLSMFQEW